MCANTAKPSNVNPLMVGLALPLPGLPGILVSEQPIPYQHQEELESPHQEILPEIILAGRQAQCAQIPDLLSHTNKAAAFIIN